MIDALDSAPARALPYEIAARSRLPAFVSKLVFGAPLAPSREAP
jgi:hypothetical protein